MKTPEKIAEALSIVLGPQVWLPVLIVSILLKSGLSSEQLLILFPTLFIFQIFIPIAYVHLATYLRKATAWDLPKRQDRYYFLIVTFISYIVSVVMIYFFGNQFIFNLSLISLVLLLIITITTYFWKISLHASMGTVGAILLNFLFSWQLSWLYLLIPLIFWARLTLGRHNFLQLMAGSLVSGAVVITSLYLFGYL